MHESWWSSWAELEIVGFIGVCQMHPTITPMCHR
jgi:hypothetical protein